MRSALLRLPLVVTLACTTFAAGQDQTLDDLFPRDRLVSVDIVIAEDDWNTLRFQNRDIMATFDPRRQFEPVASPYTYVPASVTIDGVTYAEVGLRKKGFIGSQDSERPSLKIKLDRFEEGADIGGLNNLTLNNNKQDRSLMSQFMGYELFRAAGCPAPRCAFAKVTVNGRSLGVYCHVETWRAPALERCFGSAGGVLFEGEAVDFYDGWEGSFDRKSGAEERGRAAIAEVIGALAEDDGGATIFGGAAPGRAWVATDARYDGTWYAPGFDDAAWTAGTNGAGYERETGYEHLIGDGFDFGEAMFDTATSLYLRFPFEVGDLRPIHAARTLALRMQCDDGFVAYLNGVEVARANAPREPAWDSVATAPATDDAAATFAMYDISSHRHLLRKGSNLLAIQGLNNDEESSDLLIVAQLRLSDHDFLGALWTLVDEESFYTYWAVEGLLSFWDGYSGNRNNYFVYLNPGTERLHFMPWGADGLFEAYSLLGQHPNAPMSVRGQGLLANRLYRIPEARARYAGTMRRLLADVWHERDLLAEAARIRALVEPHLSAAQARAIDFDAVPNFIRGRRAVVEAEIADGTMPEWTFMMDDLPVIADRGAVARRRGAGRGESDAGDQAPADAPTDAGFFAAAAAGDMERLADHLARGADVNALDQGGGCAIGIAALADEVEAVAFLIERGADVNLTNPEGNVPLHGAALFGAVDAVRALLDAGAHPNRRNRRGETPYDVAAAPWGPEIEGIVRFIASILQVQTGLDTVRAGRPEVIDLLAARGGASGAALGAPAEGSIWVAAKDGDVESLEVLLNDGADPDPRDAMGITPVAWAVMAGQAPAVALLLEHGADPSAANADGGTPLHGAAFLGRTTLVSVLIRSGANVNPRNVRRETPLDIVSFPWSDAMSGVVTRVAGSLRIEIDPAQVRAAWPAIAAVLREHGGKRGSAFD